MHTTPVYEASIDACQTPRHGRGEGQVGDDLLQESKNGLKQEMQFAIGVD
jgi:hypothetical protein